MHHRSRSLLVLALATSTGCASSSYKGLSDTGGQKLGIAPLTEQVPNVRVTEIRDHNGGVLGTEQTITGYRTVTTGYRLELGEAMVDEQDFYHLTGDRASEDKVAQARAKGMRMHRIGWAMMAASLATAIAVPIVAGPGIPSYAAVGQAFVMIPVGFGLVIFGKKRVEQLNFPATHAFGALEQPAPAWAERLSR